MFHVTVYRNARAEFAADRVPEVAIKIVQSYFRLVAINSPNGNCYN